jgi:serine/threonine-protein kinase
VVKVTDFGIARAGASQMTEEGAIIGTAQYLSPEQARGAPVDQTSDLYSTGIVLYELLTGEVPFTGDSPVEIAMKHLSEVPDTPSEHRPEVPDDLDLVVVRALAKEPAERYSSAAAMDADLETVARGGHVPVETAEAATMVLTGSRDDAATAVTQITRRARPGPVYEPAGSRRRAAWPWLLGVGVLLAALVAGWLLWDPIQDQLGGSDTVAVPYVEGLAQANAEAQIREEGLIPQVNRVPNSDVEEGLVFSQSPDEGTRVEPETVVRINVSSGKPEVTVPSVVGQTESDAVAELTRVGLDAQIVQVNSPEEPGRVTGQFPSAGTVVVEGTRVRINVSKGPRPVTVPSVVDLPFDQAAAELRGAGFDVSRIDVASDLARGIVVSQDPDGGSEASRGSTVTLSVSQGPTTAAVPDVTGTDVAIAQNTLEAAGFRTRVVLEDTDDPASDGIVISQDPAGSSQAELDSIVTLFVGRFVGTTDGGETTTTIP